MTQSLSPLLSKWPSVPAYQRLIVFSCRRLTPFKPFNLTFAYPYGKG